MTENSNLQDLAREAKATMALAFRNGPIEDVHAGKPCPACAGKSGASRISDDKMKLIMKNAVNRVYPLLRLKTSDPDGYAREIAYGARCAVNWDEPEYRLLPAFVDQILEPVDAQFLTQASERHIAPPVQIDIVQLFERIDAGIGAFLPQLTGGDIS